jgi:membrane-associated phospholipid phosphatase
MAPLFSGMRRPGAAGFRWRASARQQGGRPGWNLAVGGVLVLAVALSLPDNRRLGDALQVVLPLAALACAAARGQAPEIVGRYAILEVGIKVPKHTLGALPVNQRPDGGGEGFPSGHAAAASFGAAHLAYYCAGLHPATRAAALLAAGFTGGSRIESGKHTLWQVMAGALWGWAVVLVPGAALRAAAGWLRGLFRRLPRGAFSRRARAG